jgi:hypothetical protein
MCFVIRQHMIERGDPVPVARVYGLASPDQYLLIVNAKPSTIIHPRTLRQKKAGVTGH